MAHEPDRHAGQERTRHDRRRSYGERRNVRGEAAAAGQTGVEFLENKIGTLVKNTGNPFVNGLFTLLEADFGPELNALLTGLAGQGVTTVTKLIPEVAAWLVKEEANV